MALDLDFPNPDNSDQKKETEKKEYLKINPPRHSSLSKADKYKVQRRTIFLPASKQNTQLSFIKVQCDKIKVSEFNQRNQSLLSIKDPSIVSLMTSIKDEGQREPVLLRPLEDDNYELIWGSRRLFSIIEINKEKALCNDNDPLLVEAWTSNSLNDEDARCLSIGENENRQDISVYEKGLYYRDLKELDGLSIEEIQEKENIAASTIYEYIRISKIPIEIIKLLKSPTLLTSALGTTLSTQLKKINSTDLDKFILEHDDNSFDNLNYLIKEIRGLKNTPNLSIPLIESFDKKTLSAELKVNNKSKKLTLKVDRYDDEFVDKLKSFFNSFD